MAALSSGDRLGVYEIGSPLGAGGMGEVCRARDTKLGRDVALKVLPDSLAHDPERLVRFEREAHLLAALNHPSIAHIHGLEDSTGTVALVMELVDGPTLAERIAQAPFHSTMRCRLRSRSPRHLGLRVRRVRNADRAACVRGDDISTTLAAVLKTDPDWSALPTATTPSYAACFAGTS